MINKEKIKVGVHNGQFHPDDVMCVVMLQYKYGTENVEVVRTRDPEILKTCDYVLDVGDGVLVPGSADKITDTQVIFDHHAKAEYYENGIKKSACGKLAEYLFGENKEMLNKMRKSFLYAIEALDNGQLLEQFGMNSDNSIFDFVRHLNPTWRENFNEVVDNYFKEACSAAYKTFVHVHDNIIAQIEAKEYFNKFFKDYDKETGVLYLEKYFPWTEFVIDANTNGANIFSVCYEDLDNHYVACSVPKSINSFSPPMLPEEWAGLAGEELKKVSGIESAIFCHKDRFFFVCENKRDALKVAFEIAKNQEKTEKENVISKPLEQIVL